MTSQRWQALTALFLFSLSCGSCGSPTPVTSPSVPANTTESQNESGKLSPLTPRPVSRPATREDCELVVDQNVTLILRESNVTDPTIVEKRKQEIRASMAPDIEACIGRRVTDEVISCVRKSETAKAIDDCLR